MNDKQTLFDVYEHVEEGSIPVTEKLVVLNNKGKQIVGPKLGLTCLLEEAKKRPGETVTLARQSGSTICSLRFDGAKFEVLAPQPATT